MAPVSGLKFGLVVSGGADIAELEQLPVDSLWVGGHVASRNASPEPMASLARLVALTTRVQVGTAVVVLPLYPPALIAKQLADLDVASGGRLVFGLGVGGEYPQEFRACGVPLNERGARTDEAVGLIRRLWEGKEVSHAGRFYPMESVRLIPSPHQRGGPPIVIAGRRRPAMRRAARMGDGWMPYLYSPRRYADSVEAIHAEAATLGRALDGFDWFAYIFVNINDDAEVARVELASALGRTYDQDVRTMIGSVAAAGRPEDVTQRLCDFVDAGARHLILLPFGGHTQDVQQRLMTEVLPAVRLHANRSA